MNVPQGTAVSGKAEFRFTVLYDGDCPLCMKSVETLRARDFGGILDFLPAQDPRVPKSFSWISPEALSASIHLVGPGGETWEGIGAVEQLTRILPGYRWLSYVLAFPIFRRMAGGIYRLVARNRYKIRCGSHC